MGLECALSSFKGEIPHITCKMPLALARAEQPREVIALHHLTNDAAQKNPESVFVHTSNCFISFSSLQKEVLIVIKTNPTPLWL